MAEARSGPSVALLPDGRVLAAGGWGSTERFGPKLASAELYDPASGTWTPAAAMRDARHGSASILLPSGMVLVAGGYNDSARLASAELYDPATGTWNRTGNLPEPFGTDTVILMANGMVLIAGGDVPRGGGAIGSAHAAVYDPTSGTWTLTASMTTARLQPAAVLLPDGRALVSGGRVNGGPTSGTFASAELYDPVTATWRAIGNMTVARSGQTATLLLDGRVLMVGGVTGTVSEVLASAELFALVGGS
jgi:N-acetylneuraminic acid mutarotase